MAISGNIFKTATEAQAESGKDDNVGRFRSGYQVNGMPVALDAFRITTADPAVAVTVAELLGAASRAFHTRGFHNDRQKTAFTLRRAAEKHKLHLRLS